MGRALPQSCYMHAVITIHLFLLKKSPSDFYRFEKLITKSTYFVVSLAIIYKMEEKNAGVKCTFYSYSYFQVHNSFK